MIISILVKALLFYFLYKVIKGALGAYTVYKRVQAQAQAHTQGSAGGSFSSSTKPGYREPGARTKKADDKGTVEAEYRVLKED